MSRGERWWHAFQGDCECGTSVTLLAGDSPEHPEALAKRLEGAIVPMRCMVCHHNTEVFYVRSWDHEPTDDERQLAGIEAA